jgi:hypothetical protein
VARMRIIGLNLNGAFCSHCVQIPDDMFPEQWKNLSWVSCLQVSLLWAWGGSAWEWTFILIASKLNLPLLGDVTFRIYTIIMSAMNNDYDPVCLRVFKWPNWRHQKATTLSASATCVSIAAGRKNIILIEY